MIKQYLLAFTLVLGSAAAQAQACPHRGDLDTPFCDVDQDLVADTPARTVAPKRLVVGISYVEDSAAAYRIYSPLVDHLSSCLKQEVMLHTPVGESKVLEAMRTGQVHIAQFATGGTAYAVNFAGAVPFAGKGNEAEKKRDSYTLMLIAAATSSYRKPTDLVGKKIAHTSLTSNSGNLAPRVLFPELGLEPEKNYKVEFSGKHENSIRGVQLGLYDAAAVASDTFHRLVSKGEIKPDQFRVLYESDSFPTDTFTYAHNLDGKLVGQIKQCFADFRIPETMVRQLDGNNRFFPANYSRDWKLVRLISKASGAKMDREAYDKIIAGKK